MPYCAAFRCSVAVFVLASTAAYAQKAPAAKAAAAAPDAGATPAKAPDAGAAALKDVPPPTPAEAKKVIDYYYNGKAKGPVLVELKACTKVDPGNNNSPYKNECLEAVAGPIKKGTNVHAWSLWLVPDGGTYEDVILQFVFDGQVRSSMDIKLTTSLRSRTWRTSPLTRAGKWELRAVRGDTVLGSTSVTVLDD
jgi:hypothetical protein